MRKAPRMSAKIDMRKNAGFTLVELVVVIMILGILAGVAAPKFINTSAEATENGLRQTLSTIRSAIEIYTARETTALTAANLVTQLEGTYIRGTFPECPVGPNAGNATVAAGTTPTGAAGWMYDAATQTFIVNSTATDSNSVAYNTY